MPDTRAEKLAAHYATDPVLQQFLAEAPDGNLLAAENVIRRSEEAGLVVLDPQSAYTQPRILCYVEGEGRDAAIVHTRQEVLDFIETQWAGEPIDPAREPDVWEDVLADVNTRPDRWGDGAREVTWEFETGYMRVTLLSDHWDEQWTWGDSNG